MLYLFAKLVFLYLAIQWSLINEGKLIRGYSISFGELFLQSIGIVGFIALQWMI